MSATPESLISAKTCGARENRGYSHKNLDVEPCLWIYHPFIPDSRARLGTRWYSLELNEPGTHLTLIKRGVFTKDVATCNCCTINFILFPSLYCNVSRLLQLKQKSTIFQFTNWFRHLTNVLPGLSSLLLGAVLNVFPHPSSAGFPSVSHDRPPLSRWEWTLRISAGSPEFSTLFLACCRPKWRSPQPLIVVWLIWLQRSFKKWIKKPQKAYYAKLLTVSPDALYIFQIWM